MVDDMFQSFLPVLPIFLLLLVALILVAIRAFNRDFYYFWIIAAIGALIAWPIILLLYSNIPKMVQLFNWRPGNIYLVSPALLLDNLSWSYALAIATLLLAVILTDVSRAAEADWSAWVGSLFLASLGIWAVMSANPLTLVMAWTALDIVELATLLSYFRDSTRRERVVISFSAKVFGTLLLVWSGVLASASGTNALFIDIPPQAGIYLLLAAGMRLGVLPLQQPYLSDIPLRRGLGTMIRLVPAAAALVLLGRVAEVGINIQYINLIELLIGLTAIYSCGSWLASDNELDGRPYWILALASFSSVAAIRSQMQASSAWGIALLLSGGLLFLMSSRNRYLRILAAFGILGVSALPFTPAWDGVYIFAGPHDLVLVALLFSHALVMVGYIKFALQSGEQLTGVERWVWVIYPWGLALLPFTHFIIGFLGERQMPTALIDWVGLVSIGLAGLLIGLRRRLGGNEILERFVERAFLAIQSIFSFNWLYRALWFAYHFFSRVLRFITGVMEGEGGILWTLLLLVLFITLLTQLSQGV